MSLPLMRRIVGDAGNIERLYLAVKASADVSLDNEKLQWKRFIELIKQKQLNFGGLTLGPSCQGRSAEPHLALAKELNLLEVSANRAGRNSPSPGRWMMTVQAGKPFLKLWEENQHRPPTYFMLAQILRMDRMLLLPFILGVLNRGRSESPRVVAEIWEQLWQRYTIEMVHAEPPLPRSLFKNGQVLKRTAKHHADARIRFLMKTEGLNLTEDQLKRFANAFSGFERKSLPPDLYFKIGFSISGTSPKPMEENEALSYVELAHSALQRSGIASSQALFNYINEICLPEQTMDWNLLQHLLRTSSRFSLYPGLLQDDTLVSLKHRTRESF